MRAWILLVVPALLVAPAASAAAIEAQLTFPEGVSLRGATSIVTSRGVLDLAGALDGLEIGASAASGWRVTHSWELAGQPPAEVYRGAAQPENESLTLGAGTLRGFACVGDCRAILFSDDGGQLLLAGATDGPLRSLAQPLSFAAHAKASGIEDTFYYEASSGWFRASSAASDDATSIVDVAPAATGAVSLFLANVSATFTGAQGETQIDTRTVDGPLEGPAGIPIGRRIQTRFLVLRLSDVALTPGAGGEWALLAPSPSIALDGEIAAASAFGELRAGSSRRELEGQSVRIDGVLAALPSLSGGGLAPAPLARPESGAAISGDARQVLVAGAPVAGAGGARGATVAGVTLGALMLAALAFVKLVGIGPLYTRIERGTVLQNDNRRRVYDTIRGAPGCNTADLVRLTGMAEVVVRHHLRMLEEHQFVIMRPSGRLRTYFALDGRVDPQLAGVYGVLKDESRRLVATAVVDGPGATQKEIAERTGISQRLVSYHLGRLENDGLVVASGSNPRRYDATEKLRGFLGAGAPATAAA